MSFLDNMIRNFFTSSIFWQATARHRPPRPSLEDGDRPRWDAQLELALQLVSAQPVSVQLVSVLELSERARGVERGVERVAEVESRSPVWRALGPASEAAHEQLMVLAPYAPALGPYSRVAPLQQVLPALLQQPDEQQTALLQERLWR